MDRNRSPWGCISAQSHNGDHHRHLAHRGTKHVNMAIHVLHTHKVIIFFFSYWNRLHQIQTRYTPWLARRLAVQPCRTRTLSPRSTYRTLASSMASFRALAVFHMSVVHSIDTLHRTDRIVSGLPVPSRTEHNIRPNGA